MLFLFLINLNLGRDERAKDWCQIVFSPHHRGWIDQNLTKQWTNVSVSLFPYITKGFQLTGSANSYPTKVFARIITYEVYILESLFQFIKFSIFYSSDVFPLYLGLYNATLLNFSSYVRTTNFCDVSNLTLGI